MASTRKSTQNLTLHVLVVEGEPAELNRTAARLLAEGVDVSTCRTPFGLAERVARIQPDVVLMDVLMQGLDTKELAQLAALCHGAKPALVVHTKMLKSMLRRVVDPRAVYGFIPKSDDDDAFLRAFRDVGDRIVSDMPTATFIPRLVGVMSGTYAMNPTAAPAGRSARK
jgi:CheY-like chemotaxis protein